MSILLVGSLLTFASGTTLVSAVEMVLALAHFSGYAVVTSSPPPRMSAWSMIALIRAWSLAVADTISVLLYTSGLTTAVGAIGLMEVLSADGLAHLSAYTSRGQFPILRFGRLRQRSP